MTTSLIAELKCPGNAGHGVEPCATFMYPTLDHLFRPVRQIYVLHAQSVVFSHVTRNKGETDVICVYFPPNHFSPGTQV